KLALQRYRLWRRGILTALVLWLVLPLLALLVSESLRNSNDAVPGGLISLLAYFAVVPILIALDLVKVTFFRCPGCGSFFSISGPWWSTPRVPKSACVHCGLSEADIQNE